MAEESAVELVAKAVARSRAIKSGRFKMTYVAPELAITSEHTFKPGLWLHRFRDDTYDAEYDDTHISYVPKQAIVYSRTGPQWKPKFPGAQMLAVFAGSFWTTEQAAWAEKHLADFTTVGSERYGDDVAVICQAPCNYPGFGNAVHLDSQCQLRLHIAPSLGYALPLYELYSGSGKLQCRWTATDFQECAAGIFVAGSIRKETANKTDAELNPATCQKRTHKVSADKINSPLGDEDLYFTIPAGSFVQDVVSNVRFQLKDDVSSKRIVTLSDKAAALPAKELQQPIGLDD